MDCLCGGTGKLSDAHAKVTELYLHERNEHEDTKDAFAQLQKAVLAFLFHPEFKRYDRNSFFRRYWEDKLNVKISVATRTKTEKKPEAKMPISSSQHDNNHDWHPGAR